MHEHVERAEDARHGREQAVHGGVVGRVALLEQLGPDALGQRPDATLELGGGVGEPEPRAFLVQGPGDAPGDRASVGDAGDERRLAVEQPHQPIASSEKRRKTSEMSCPPKPNELDMAVRTGSARATLGT